MKTKMLSMLMLLVVVLGFSGVASAAPVEDFTQDLLVLHENGTDDELYAPQTGKHTLHFYDNSTSAPTYADTVGSDGWGFWDSNAEDDTYPSYGSEVVDEYKASGAISGNFHFLVLDQKDGPKIVLSHVQDLVFPQPPVEPPVEPPVVPPVEPPVVPPVEPPVVEPVVEPVAEETIPMQNTGGSVVPIALAILLVLAGLGIAASRRNK